jgi:hypothetical protein
MVWRWKSRKAGRPKIDRDLRDLIRRMNRENPLWGASRIHGELLMLIRGRKPPSQSWKTFLRSHAAGIAAVDMCVVPTVTLSNYLLSWFWAMAGENSYGLRSLGTRLPSG